MRLNWWGIETVNKTDLLARKVSSKSRSEANKRPSREQKYECRDRAPWRSEMCSLGAGGVFKAIIGGVLERYKKWTFEPVASLASAESKSRGVAESGL